MSESPDRSAASDRLPTSVSVVIPTRGRPQLVQRAIASALQQTLQPSEVIVVVDGPDAESVAILNSLQDPRLVVIPRDRSGGAAAARNTGVSAATGHWVAFLDDDDVWLTGKLERQIAAAHGYAHDQVVVACAFWAVTTAGTYVWPRRSMGAEERVGDYLFVRDLPGEGMLSTPTLLVSRSLAERVPFPESLQVHEDYDWLLQLEAAGADFCVLTTPLARAHIGPGRDSLSGGTGWQQSLGWALSRADLLSPKAFSGFLLTEAAQKIGSRGRWRLALAVLLVALEGRVRARDLFRYLFIQLVPKELRWRLGDLYSRFHSFANGSLKKPVGS